MKRQVLFLSMTTFFALNALAQTPYDNFAPEQSVKPIIEMPKMHFKVANTNLNSEIRSIEFDKNTLSLNLLNESDSVLKSITLNPNDKKFTSIDPLTEKYYHISPYAYCMNNPIRYIDPNGMDVYRLMIKQEKCIYFYKPMTTLTRLVVLNMIKRQILMCLKQIKMEKLEPELII